MRIIYDIGVVMTFKNIVKNKDVHMYFPRRTLFVFSGNKL